MGGDSKHMIWMFGQEPGLAVEFPDPSKVIGKNRRGYENISTRLYELCSRPEANNARELFPIPSQVDTQRVTSEDDRHKFDNL